MKAGSSILRVMLCAIFLYAANVKIVDPQGFHAAILTYHLVPEAAVKWIALGLPWLELCAGLALLLPAHRTGALWVLLGLMIVFLAALGQGWARGLDLTCGCFGTEAGTRVWGYWKFLYRDLVLVTLIVFLLVRERAPSPANPPPAA